MKASFAVHEGVHECANEPDTKIQYEFRYDGFCTSVL